MDGGSAYGVGNTLSVTGTATTTGYLEGYVTVTNVYDNVGDVVRVSGVSSASYKDYNQLYRITGIATGLTKEITVSSASTVGGASTTGIANNVDASTFGYLTECIRNEIKYKMEYVEHLNMSENYSTPPHDIFIIVSKKLLAQVKPLIEKHKELFL